MARPKLVDICNPLKANKIVEVGLEFRQQEKRAMESLFLSFTNLAVSLGSWYLYIKDCYYMPYHRTVQITVIAVTAVCALYYFCMFIYNRYNKNSLKWSDAQRNLLLLNTDKKQAPAKDKKPAPILHYCLCPDEEHEFSKCIMPKSRDGNNPRPLRNAYKYFSSTFGNATKMLSSWTLNQPQKPGSPPMNRNARNISPVHHPYISTPISTPYANTSRPIYSSFGNISQPSFASYGNVTPQPINTSYGNTSQPLNTPYGNSSQSLNIPYGNLSSPINKSFPKTSSPQHNMFVNVTQYLNNSYSKNGQQLCTSLQNSALSHSDPDYPRESLYAKHLKDEISDEESLRKYLKHFAEKEPSSPDTSHPRYSYKSDNQSSFWSYCGEAAQMFTTSVYELSPTATTSIPKRQSPSDDSSTLTIQFDESSGIPLELLTKYIGNLRNWISLTIFKRLIKEIDNINETVKNYGLINDFQIGCVSLDRLRKIVENREFVNQFLPKLPMVLPFLEISANQEYLVKRIRDFAKGSCISEYKWNGGSVQHGQKWDEHLPTDSSILFHALCIYFDSQLLPLPQGQGRSFYHHYIIVGNGKRLPKDVINNIKNKSNCAIFCTNLSNPILNFISDSKIHKAPTDHNNVFYAFIQFLIYMKKHCFSSLEGVSLGRSGINITCVIEN